MKSKSKSKDVKVIISGLIIFTVLLMLLVFLSGVPLPFSRGDMSRLGPMQLIYYQDFESSDLSDKYDVKNMTGDFSIGGMKPEHYTVGLGEYSGRSRWKKKVVRRQYNVCLVESNYQRGGVELENKCLMITHRAGKYGILGSNEGNGSGAAWTARFPGNHQELYLSYNIKREEGAEPLKEAKVPCLMGSFTYNQNQGFRANSIMNRKEIFGHSWLISLPGKESFVEPWIDPATGSFWSYSWNDSTWYNLTFRICVNSVDEESGRINSDGLVEAFVNGRLISQITGLKLMEKDFSINQLAMHFFIGGSTPEYAPKTDQDLFIDDVCLFVYDEGSAPGLRVPSDTDRKLKDLPGKKWAD